MTSHSYGANQNLTLRNSVLPGPILAKLGMVDYVITGNKNTKADISVRTKLTRQDVLVSVLGDVFWFPAIQSSTVLSVLLLQPLQVTQHCIVMVYLHTVIIIIISSSSSSSLTHLLRLTHLLDLSTAKLNDSKEKLNVDLYSASS